MAIINRQDAPTCRSCGADILWVEMSSGKKMPVDPKRLSIVHISPVNDQGVVVQGYTSHFATCPNAKKHRKDGGK